MDQVSFKMAGTSGM